MPTQDDIGALRRLLESVNRLAVNNGQSIGKIASDQQVLRSELATSKRNAERAIQLCNDMAARLAVLEAK